MLAALKHWFSRPPRRFGVGAILTCGVILGLVAWGAVSTFAGYANTTEYCISCHEMRDTVYADYEASKHYTNASGVRASCADCHVPAGWVGAATRATNDLYHKLIGSIDTQAKFEARRPQLAENVWRRMEESGSRECRNCHSFEAMDFHEQSRRASSKMKAAMKKGKSCIECHKGVTHKLPPEYEEDDD